MTDEEKLGAEVAESLALAAANWAKLMGFGYRLRDPAGYKLLREQVEAGTVHLQISICINDLEHDFSLLAVGPGKPRWIASQSYTTLPPGAPN